MKDSLKRLATRLNPFTSAPAKAATPAARTPVMEADDKDEYSSAAAEEIINRLCDQLDSTQAQVRALAKTNRNLTKELTHANAAISALRKQPKNRYWGSVRKGK